MMTNDEVKYAVKALSDRLSEERFPHIMAASNKERNNASFAFAGNLTDFTALLASSIAHFSQKYGIKKKVLLKAVAVTLGGKAK